MQIEFRDGLLFTEITISLGLDILMNGKFTIDLKKLELLRLQ
jgi:hypothetical protein